MKRLIIAGIWATLLLNVESNPQSNNLIIETTKVTPDATVLAAAEVHSTMNWQEVKDTSIQLDYEDAQALMKIAYAEGGNQGVEGQLLIMEVCYNRMLSDDYPNTITEVITQKGQFESYRNGQYAAAEPTAETHLALAELEKGIDLDSDIIAFETCANHKSLERYFEFSFTYQDHDFYVKK